MSCVKEDVEGEETETGEEQDNLGRATGSSIEDFVIHNRIRKQFGNTGMYLQVIQQLLELGDARRVHCTDSDQDSRSLLPQCTALHCTAVIAMAGWRRLPSPSPSPAACGPVR
jgi:hypothetical protein